MSTKIFHRLMEFLSDLERKGINYTLAHNRDEAIMVIAVVPGERWEVEFLDDGTVEVERFLSSGEICGEEVLSDLFARYSGIDSDNLDSPQLAEVVALGE